MNRQVLDELKQQIPLLEYLQAQDWQPARVLSRCRWMGLCPLHTDHKPSFLVDPNKNLFYCYGCGRGGDVIRFAELYHQVNFPQAVALLRQWCGLAPLLNAVFDFYRLQLHRYNEAIIYLDQRGIHSYEVIEHMRIGYAPGRCLRSWLTQLGYPLSVLQQAGLVTAAGHDSYIRCITFPLESNLYGRGIRNSAIPHRFMSGSKGGLYLWEQVRQCPEVILVEGLFDYAVLWQAGFRNLTCSLGNHLNAHQFQQLCEGPRTVYLAFDADTNGSGPRAAQSLSRRLWAQGVTVRRVALPEGHDPNSFFAQGGDVGQFQDLLEAGPAMKFGVIRCPTGNPAQSPFRIIERTTKHEVEWANRFLDRECLRRVTNATLYGYAYHLLHFIRWWVSVQHTDEITESALTESTLLDYLRFQSSQQPPFSGSTINERVAVADRALRAVFPHAPSQVARGFQETYWRRAPMGLGRPVPALSRLRVRTPKRTIVPLSVDEVARFWSSFRSARDLAIVGLMLFEGLRSKEVLDLNRGDLLLPEAQIRVCGKGQKTRLLPLAPEAVHLLEHYLRLERPQSSTAAVFVSLKGRARGARMTPAGLRSLFRYHRQTTGIAVANPHRFRHTFASDMVRAGVSLPALMQLMGHANIQTTMVYVEVSPLEVYQQYTRAVAQLIRPVPGTSS